MSRARLAAACSAAVFVASALTVVVMGTTAPAAAYEFRHEVTDDFDCDGVRDYYWSDFQATVSGAEIAGQFTIRYSRGFTRTYSQATAGIQGRRSCGTSSARPIPATTGTATAARTSWCPPRPRPSMARTRRE